MILGIVSSASAVGGGGLVGPPPPTPGTTAIVMQIQTAYTAPVTDPIDMQFDSATYTPPTYE